MNKNEFMDKVTEMVMGDPSIRESPTAPISTSPSCTPSVKLQTSRRRSL